MDQFRTHEISIVAVLLFEKCFLLDIDRSSPQVEFVFENSDKVRGVVTRYMRDQLPYPAPGLFAALRRAKKILYDTSA
jgi:hypothetical protein